MSREPDSPAITLTQAREITHEQLSELLHRQSWLERENAELRRQLAWFQRQLFGQKSERRIVQLEVVQGSLGQDFCAVPDQTPPTAKRDVQRGWEINVGERPLTDSANAYSRPLCVGLNYA
jgi:transposase